MDFKTETFEAKGGFDRNCKVCKGTGWMPKKGDPKDAKTAKLLGVSIDELTMQPCNAGGKDMGCFNAETFEAPIMPFNRSGRPCPSCRSWSQSFIGGVCSRCASKDRKKAETFNAEGDFKKGMQMGAGAIVGIMGVQVVVGGVVYGLLKLMGKE